jgi:hypothetical protein
MRTQYLPRTQPVTANDKSLWSPLLDLLRLTRRRAVELWFAQRTVGVANWWQWPYTVASGEGLAFWFFSWVFVVLVWLVSINGYLKWFLLALAIAPALVPVFYIVSGLEALGFLGELVSLPFMLAACFGAFYVIGFALVVICGGLYYLFSMGYWREGIGVLIFSFLQLLVMGVYKKKWALPLAPFFGVGASSCILFLFVHLTLDSFSDERLSLRLEMAVSDVFYRLKYPFGHEHQIWSAWIIFLILFVVAGVFEYLAPGVRFLKSLRILKTTVSRLKSAALVLSCFSLTMAQTEQFGIKTETAKMKDARRRARAAFVMADQMQRFSPSQKSNLVDALIDISTESHSAEIAEEAADRVYSASIVSNEHSPSDVEVEDQPPTFASVREAEMARTEAVKDEIKKSEGFRRALQTVIDEVNSFGIHKQLAPDSALVEVILSAVSKVVSEFEYARTEVLAARLVETLGNSSRDKGGSSELPYGDKVIQKAVEDVHDRYSPHTNPGVKGKEPKDMRRIEMR